MRSRLRIAVVGGGAKGWAPSLVKDMLLKEGLSDAHFILLDIDREAAELTKAFLEKLAAKLGVEATFQATTQRAALKGADYAIITISTGGLKAMAHDLAIPEKFGIYHTVGDTTGPGGWARTIRNFDVFVSLARDFNRYCPGAPVLNYSNPMTTLTTVLARLCKAPVIGLCHGLFGNLRQLAGLYRVPEERISVSYAGVNHFFWITRAAIGGRDILADLLRRMRKATLDEIFRKASEDPLGYKSNHAVADELLRLTGAMPYLGDRHICEGCSCYITNLANIRKYRLTRTTIADRRRNFGVRARGLKRMIGGEIPPHFFTPSRETAADIIHAHSHGRDFIDVGNVPNAGQVSNLPLGSVLETAVRVSAGGFEPVTYGDLPEIVRAMVEPWCAVFDMQVDACFAGDIDMALRALRLDPLCAHLNAVQVNDMGRRLLRAHREFISVF